MKRLTITTILFGALAFSSCNKYLDVTPRAQTTKDQIFSTEKGFRDALTGAYIQMKSNNTYGGGLMWSTIEYMARNWDVQGNSITITNLTNATYTDAQVRGTLDNTYADLYKVIASVNSILERIDGQQSIFTGNNYALIKGEALALRAFNHFDVLRMFGPMPDNSGNTTLLPYVTEVTHDIITPVNFQEFAKNILADLDAAEALMKDKDPILSYSLAELNPVASSSAPPVVADNFYMYRQIRLNYYAVLALKARVYMYLAATDPANKVKAAQYAQLVVDAKDRTGRPTFRLGRESDRVAGDYLMSAEHIAALSVYNLETIATGTFGESGQLARNDFNIQDGFYYLNNLFPVAERTSDVRWKEMWVYKLTNPSYVMYRKFIQKPSAPVLQVPLLRLSEMYLILTECAGTKETAETWYRAYCNEKGIPFPSGFNATAWETDRKNKMIREYVREFYGEGQTFFTYKRYNVTTLPASWTYSYYTGTPARYVVPKPDREINYNNK
ncbi:RagB/SusD family nutrient uptake outer membrane protein [Chitinophaga sp. sic0106]|uniref:RagB/SusD family nutrient uptake outer membrane protein n=1 Tax=Chitinophaga sp. sic0106 TaxID=2854785 RepID=UPI001C48C311|nr:RagB/SusD family nutrient uptake outer membrane protein [Chitinophaga sp. sic0106]MBV7529647.1 RagB/SusD family nutrient uptake outer membrane protein [Chitinophaga sp. sic0106]